MRNYHVYNYRIRIGVWCAGGVAMSVAEREHIFDMIISEYGLNKVTSIVAGTIAGALIGFILCLNIIPNESKVNEEKEIRNYEN